MSQRGRPRRTHIEPPSASELALVEIAWGQLALLEAEDQFYLRWRKVDGTVRTRSTEASDSLVRLTGQPRYDIGLDGTREWLLDRVVRGFDSARRSGSVEDQLKGRIQKRLPGPQGLVAFLAKQSDPSTCAGRLSPSSALTVTRSDHDAGDSAQTSRAGGLAGGGELEGGIKHRRVRTTESIRVEFEDGRYGSPSGTLLRMQEEALWDGICRRRGDARQHVEEMRSFRDRLMRQQAHTSTPSMASPAMVSIRRAARAAETARQIDAKCISEWAKRFGGDALAERDAKIVLDLIP